MPVVHSMNRLSPRSKILLSIVYLWTGRGPEIDNGASTTAARALGGPARRWCWRDRARSQKGESFRRGNRGGHRGERDGAAAVAGGGAEAAGGPVLADRGGVRGSQPRRAAVGPGAGRVRSRGGAGVGAGRPGQGVVAGAGSAGGADDGGWAGAAGRDEPQPGRREAECHPGARG